MHAFSVRSGLHGLLLFSQTMIAWPHKTKEQPSFVAFVASCRRCIHLFVHCIHSFTHSCSHSCIHSFTHSLIPTFTHSFSYSLISSSIHWVIQSISFHSIHSFFSFTHLLHSFISLIYSFNFILSFLFVSFFSFNSVISFQFISFVRFTPFFDFIILFIQSVTRAFIHSLMQSFTHFMDSWIHDSCMH